MESVRERILVDLVSALFSVSEIVAGYHSGLGVVFLFQAAIAVESVQDELQHSRLHFAVHDGRISLDVVPFLQHFRDEIAQIGFVAVQEEMFYLVVLQTSLLSQKTKIIQSDGLAFLVEGSSREGLLLLLQILGKLEVHRFFQFLSSFPPFVRLLVGLVEGETSYFISRFV